ncbi:D-alanyl-D-alanine carboxypeptidase (penicillin-binding protein 5/6) [Lachnospiraceae bacterium]|nr:D-alanyl-D-alanine carboxypeptidase (penicillin-binding protein 5/6) [Lachnospiraceae bacterium]
MGRAVIYYILLILLSAASIWFVVKKNTSFKDAYSEDIINELNISKENYPGPEGLGFQSRVAVATDEEINANQFKDDCYAAILVNNETREMVVSHNALKRIYPASTTKLMTGIVVCDALNNGEISLDDEVTLEYDTNITESGALISDLRAGAKISVRNLLYGLMMRSYNDYAVILAEYISGSESAFCDRMNEKAREIGATNSHFANAHGLHDDDHYITAYDMYLILNEAKKYDMLKEIDSYDTFTYTYIDDYGNPREDDISPTNQFLSGNYKLPSNIKLHEWKTGTTDLAGNILTMNVEIDEKSYSIFVADGDSQDDLYDKIGIMFNLTR